MKDFLLILKRFVAPYKKYVALNIIFNILAAFLTLFSFAIIVPILEMLFEIKQEVYTFIPWSEGSAKDVIVNNFYYYTQEILAQHGPSFTLAMLAVALVFMTLLKTGATYLSSYCVQALYAICATAFTTKSFHFPLHSSHLSAKAT